MAGRPRTRQRLQLAEAQVENLAQEHIDRVQRIHLNLIKRGIDPQEIDADAPGAAVMLAEYSPDLPLAIVRLAGSGQPLEVIRDTLGFSEAQQRDWSDQYVDFAGAISRARAREEAFWYRQLNTAAASGDRTSLTSIQALITKKFMAEQHQGDAQQLVHVFIGKPLEQRVDDDA